MGDGEGEPFDNLVVARHPLIQHKVSLLRERETPRKVFRETVDELCTLLAYEALRDLETEEYALETPLEAAVGRRVPTDRITVVAILRAGLGMVEGLRRLVPNARVGHVGLYRDEESLEPVDYYFNVPDAPAEQRFVVVDPMLATGGSADAALARLKRAGAGRIRFMCLVAAPTGVDRLEREHPDVSVYSAALDRELDENGFILPGLGDAGDRLFGTR